MGLIVEAVPKDKRMDAFGPIAALILLVSVVQGVEDDAFYEFGRSRCGLMVGWQIVQQ
jgi:hypothetical protein